MNRTITRSYSIFFKKYPKIKLGRWSTVDDQDTIDLKVDRANHDSCGGPLCTNVPLKTENKDTEVEESEEEELLRYYTVGSFHLHVKKEE